VNEFSNILRRSEDGDGRAAMEDLLRLVERELRDLAAARLKRENSAITLQVTDLVNEAFIRLADDANANNWQNRAHFFGAASEAMRRILVDHARRKNSLKRGGKGGKVQLSESFLAVEERADELLAVHEALDELESHDKQAAELVKLRYFVGMKHHEAAEAMEISKRIADRLWVVAKTWLFKALKEHQK